jgi:Holliday junction resolvase
MPINSKRKGASGEREFAKLCRDNGYDCRRGQQYCGIEGEDVVGLPNVHIEVKRTEKLKLYDAMDQAIRDSAEKLPIVAHRKNNCDWVVIMPVEAWFEMYREYEAGLNR